MYVNGKLRPVETIPGMWEGETKDNDGGGELSYDIRTFINVTMYPQYNNNKNKFGKRKYLCVAQNIILLSFLVFDKFVLPKEEDSVLIIYLYLFLVYAKANVFTYFHDKCEKIYICLKFPFDH
jgi:hypothetical protein